MYAILETYLRINLAGFYERECTGVLGISYDRERAVEIVTEKAGIKNLDPDDLSYLEQEETDTISTNVICGRFKEYEIVKTRFV